MTVQDDDRPLNTGDMLAEARQIVPEISALEARKRIAAGEVDLILDVREPEEWAAGHIPGAVLAVRGQLEWYADPSSPTAMPELVSHREARILVHCNTGARALLAAQTLKKMGYPNVASMLGGFDDWSMLGFPVERGTR